jgi:hypothetical protein
MLRRFNSALSIPEANLFQSIVPNRNPMKISLIKLLSQIRYKNVKYGLR